MLARNLICTDIDEFVDANTVTFLNPYSFLEIHRSDIDLNRFDKICIDGIALKLFLDKAYGGTDIQRLSFDFTSVANTVFERGAAEAQSGFILGSDQQSNDLFLSKISEMFPGIKLEGRSGYFDGDELDVCIKSLAASQCDFIVIGMGAVKQEQVAIALMDSGYTGRLYTCGGFIHQTALGGGEYYPKWIDKLNLRFAYRMYKEPSTIRRYLLDYPQAFFILFRNFRSFK